VDADGNSFVNKLTTVDVTAVTLYQVSLNVPGQVIPRDPDFQAAIAAGQQLFNLRLFLIQAKSVFNFVGTSYEACGAPEQVDCRTGGAASSPTL
jgi:hypothetical protein